MQTNQSPSAAQSNRLIEFLRHPAAYPDQPESVECKETQISWVFLAGRHAYKLKKPLKSDLLDFSTRQLRKAACESELRLNRRLSPDVYQAVVPICQHRSGKFQLGGKTNVVDWLVKMRRLDDGRTLECTLERSGNARSSASIDAKAIAERLAEFFSSQAPLTLPASEFRNGLVNRVAHNERELLKTADGEEGNVIRLVHSAQFRFLATHEQLFGDRVRDGRIVDGHGNLRSEHIYLYRRPIIIDCEFSAACRQNDIIDELALLAVECERLGNMEIGRHVFDRYYERSGDGPAPRLEAFYKSYRACHQAKSAAAQNTSPAKSVPPESPPMGSSYLRLAEKYINDLGPPLIIVVGGLMGTGKSTLAQRLSQALHAQVASTDSLRQQVSSSGNSQLEYDQGKYSTETRLDVYGSLLELANEQLEPNRTVILDGTFTILSARRMAIQLAKSRGAKLLQVECVCPREAALERIAERRQAGGSQSEARPELYDQQAASSESPSPDAPLIEIDTTLSINHQQAQVMEQITSLL